MPQENNKYHSKNDFEQQINELQKQAAELIILLVKAFWKA